MTTAGFFALLFLALTFWWVRTTIREDGLIVQVALTFALWAGGVMMLVLVLMPYGYMPVIRIVSPY